MSAPHKLQLYNTLTRRKEEFKPLRTDQVGVYCCGPTVYWFQHIGNLRAAYCWDILVKTLRRFGYPVKHVMNITDVGHLKSDADEGDDKMIIAMKREGKSPWEIARFYEKAYLEDRLKMNMSAPDIVCRATEHIAEMIAMIEKLQKHDFTYVVDGNVYFDTQKFDAESKKNGGRGYGELWGGKRTSTEEFARVEGDNRKKHPADFVLWFTLSKFPDQVMKWPSPWGIGFPGWHIECSAMASKYLGEQFDIHFGGQEHIAIHHTNEIAQSEGCFCDHLKNNTHWVQTWMHNAWLMNSKGEKMSKSDGEIATLSEIIEKGFHPLALRLFFLGAQYSTPQNFSWENLKAAQTAYDSIKEKMQEWENIVPHIFNTPLSDYFDDSKYGDRSEAIRRNNNGAEWLRCEFYQALSNDLNTPDALAKFWEALKGTMEKLTVEERKGLVLEFDQVLSLGLSFVSKGSLSAEEQILFDARATARKEKDFKKSDELRDALAKSGVVVKDTPKGQEWTRK